MAWTVDKAFSEYHDAIKLSGEHRTTANARRNWIVSQLSGRLTVMEAFAMGSIPKYTALSGYADVDVLVALHYTQHIKDRKPSAVLSTLKAALGPGAGAVRRNGQAVTVRFQSWPDVDVVPASQVVDESGQVVEYQIPDMNREVWLTTKPRTHDKRVADAAASRGPNFRQIIKMIKDWNRRQPRRLQSYHIEVIALEGAWSWDDYSWAVYQYFQAAQNMLSFHWYDGENVAGYLDWQAQLTVRQQLQTAATAANNGWYAVYANNNHKAAITHFKSVFGQRFPSYG